MSAIACVALPVICLLTVASLAFKLSSSLRIALMFCPILACHCLAICRVDFTGAVEEFPLCQACRCCTPLALGVQMVVEELGDGAAEDVIEGLAVDCKLGRMRVPLPRSNDFPMPRSASADNARVAPRGCTTNAWAELLVELPEAGNAVDDPDLRPARLRGEIGVPLRGEVAAPPAVMARLEESPPRPVACAQLLPLNAAALAPIVPAENPNRLFDGCAELLRRVPRCPAAEAAAGASMAFVCLCNCRSVSAITALGVALAGVDEYTLTT